MRISESCAKCLYDRQLNKTDNAEYLARIKELLDNREYVLGSHSDFTFVFHIVVVLLTKKCAAMRRRIYSVKLCSSPA